MTNALPRRKRPFRGSGSISASTRTEPRCETPNKVDTICKLVKGVNSRNTGKDGRDDVEVGRLAPECLTSGHIRPRLEIAK